MSLSNFVPVCMACTMASTVPQIDLNEDNHIYYIDEEKIEVIPSKTYMYSYVNIARTYRRPPTKSIYDYSPVGIEHAFKNPSLKNINRKNRKHHNIHQPGRTNCTQRYQSK